MSKTLKCHLLGVDESTFDFDYEIKSETDKDFNLIINELPTRLYKVWNSYWRSWVTSCNFLIKLDQGEWQKVAELNSLNKTLDSYYEAGVHDVFIKSIAEGSNSIRVWPFTFLDYQNNIVAKVNVNVSGCYNAIACMLYGFQVQGDAESLAYAKNYAKNLLALDEHYTKLSFPYAFLVKRDLETKEIVQVFNGSVYDVNENVFLGGGYSDGYEFLLLPLDTLVLSNLFAYRNDTTIADLVHYQFGLGCNKLFENLWEHKDTNTNNGVNSGSASIFYKNPENFTVSLAKRANLFTSYSPYQYFANTDVPDSTLLPVPRDFIENKILSDRQNVDLREVFTDYLSKDYFSDLIKNFDVEAYRSWLIDSFKLDTTTDQERIKVFVDRYEAFYNLYSELLSRNVKLYHPMHTSTVQVLGNCIQVILREPTADVSLQVLAGNNYYCNFTGSVYLREEKNLNKLLTKDVVGGALKAISDFYPADKLAAYEDLLKNPAKWEVQELKISTSRNGLQDFTYTNNWIPANEANAENFRYAAHWLNNELQYSYKFNFRQRTGIVTINGKVIDLNSNSALTINDAIENFTNVSYDCKEDLKITVNGEVVEVTDELLNRQLKEADDISISSGTFKLDLGNGVVIEFEETATAKDLQAKIDEITPDGQKAIISYNGSEIEVLESIQDFHKNDVVKVEGFKDIVPCTFEKTGYCPYFSDKVENLEAANAALTTQLTTTVADFNVTKEKLENLTESFEKQSKDLDEKTAVISELEKDKASLQKDLNEANSLISVQKESIEALQEKNSELTNTIVEKDSEIQELKESNSQLQAELTTVTDNLKEKDEAFAEELLKLAETKAEVEALKEANKVKAEEIEKLKEELAKLEANSTAQAAEAALKDSRIQSLEEDLSKLSTENQELRTIVDDLSKIKNELEETIKEKDVYIDSLLNPPVLPKKLSSDYSFRVSAKDGPVKIAIKTDSINTPYGANCNFYCNNQYGTFNINPWIHNGDKWAGYIGNYDAELDKVVLTFTQTDVWSCNFLAADGSDLNILEFEVLQGEIEFLK